METDCFTHESKTVDDCRHLIALDIDGTLLDSGTDVPAITAQAVRALRSAGHHVVLATGRSLRGAVPVAESLGLDDGWMVVSNGAITARMTEGVPDGYVVHESRTFDVSTVVDLARLRLPEVRIAVEVIGWGYDVTREFDAGQLNGAQRVVDRVDELWATPVTRAILAGAEVGCLVEALRELGVTATLNSQDWIDVTAPGLSKATALDSVREALCVDPAHTVAIGDGWNDAEMLVWAADGVAMGHAPAAIKALAKRVTGTIQENGAATVLQAFADGLTPMIATVHA
jgi:HAD superfamily hydrolase (TIGR01484 family)